MSDRFFQDIPALEYAEYTVKSAIDSANGALRHFMHPVQDFIFTNLNIGLNNARTFIGDEKKQAMFFESYVKKIGPATISQIFYFMSFVAFLVLLLSYTLPNVGRSDIARKYFQYPVLTIIFKYVIMYNSETLWKLSGGTFLYTVMIVIDFISVVMSLVSLNTIVEIVTLFYNNTSEDTSKERHSKNSSSFSLFGSLFDCAFFYLFISFGRYTSNPVLLMAFTGFLVNMAPYVRRLIFAPKKAYLSYIMAKSDGSLSGWFGILFSGNKKQVSPASSHISDLKSIQNAAPQQIQPSIF